MSQQSPLGESLSRSPVSQYQHHAQAQLLTAHQGMSRLLSGSPLTAWPYVLEVLALAYPLPRDKEPRDASFPDIGADEYVYGFNYAPVITSFPDTVAIPDSLYKYQVIAEDRDADTLTYRLITALDFLSIDSTSGLIQGTPDISDVGDHDITVEVDDGNGGLATQSYALTVDIASGLNISGNLMPEEFMLSQNYPNPFNPTTTIGFSIQKSEFVVLKIYNSLGQEVTTLVSKRLQAGYYQLEWNANQVASGVYYYLIKAGEFRDVKKMILLR